MWAISANPVSSALFFKSHWLLESFDVIDIEWHKTMIQKKSTSQIFAYFFSFHAAMVINESDICVWLNIGAVY